MIAISDKLRHQVMKLAEQYEKPEFITDDPVQFPRRFRIQVFSGDSRLHRCLVSVWEPESHPLYL